MNTSNISFFDALANMKNQAVSGMKTAGSSVANAYTNPNSKGYKYVYPLTGAAIGAGIGALMDKKKPLRGAAIGGGLGLAGGWKGGDWLKKNYFKEKALLAQDIGNKVPTNFEWIKNKPAPARTQYLFLV